MPMTLQEVLANEDLRREEFPVAREKVFVAHAGVCPLPRRVMSAIAAYVEAASRGDQEAPVLAHLLARGRSLAAELIKCSISEVALVGPTSLGLSLIAGGLRFRRNDNILIYFDDYPSNVYPWMALAEQGVEVRLINTRGLGLIRPADVMGQVDENTRLVALASCHFISGYRIDVDGIGKFLRQRGIPFCVDGIQTLGAFPTTVEHVDMLAADAHKWMLGPCGAGILYVRKEVQAQVNPSLYGWHNVQAPDFVAQEQIVLKPDARKYEVGTHNLLGLVGMIASLELLLEVGVDAIARELLRKRAWLVGAIQSRGYSVLHAEVPPENAGSIVSFYRPGADMPALYQKLLEKQIVASLRTDRTGQRYVRLSPHFYNTDSELERLVETLG